MHNIVKQAYIHRNRLIPEITAAHYLQAMTDMMSGSMLEKKRQIFDAARHIT